MNRLEIIGYIGNDAEIKDLGSNQVINFSVAVSESYINKTTNEKVINTMWFECAKWGNNTALAQYLKKGTQVYVSGKPNNRGWVNEQGEVKIVNGIQVLQIDLLAGAKVSNQNSQLSTPENSVPTNESLNAPIANVSVEDDLDLPF